VMYRGKIVESGPTDGVFGRPAHPYTKLLLSSVPRMLTSPAPAVVADTDPLAAVDGEPDADVSPYSAHQVEHGEGEGCRFRPRCPVAFARCATEPGLLPVIGSDAQAAACWHAESSQGQSANGAGA
jgi:oligopeptide/dipeptide ABC transporter ATP-binding protein